MYVVLLDIGMIQNNKDQYVNFRVDVVRDVSKVSLLAMQTFVSMKEALTFGCIRFVTRRLTKV